MNATDLLDEEVSVFVSDPWDFGVECGVGPFAAIINDAESGVMLVGLRTPVVYRGKAFLSIVAKPRHAALTFDALRSGSLVGANMMLLQRRVMLIAAINSSSKLGGVAAIGGVELVRPP